MMSKSMWKQFLTTLTVLYCIVVGGVALYHSWFFTPDEGGPQNTGHPQIAPLLAVGQEAPDFSLTDLEGNTVRLSQYRGQKLVLVELFATWCPHCQMSTPYLKALQEVYGQHLEILAINAGDAPEAPSTAPDFRDFYKTTYPILEKPDDALLKNYNLSTFPTFYLVDREGKIVWAHAGTLTREVLKDLQPKLPPLPEKS